MGDLRVGWGMVAHRTPLQPAYAVASSSNDGSRRSHATAIQAHSPSRSSSSPIRLHRTDGRFHCVGSIRT